jgi:GT2 family glycosyltransferase
MKIYGKDYSVAIIMLMMEGELEATKVSLASLLNSIGNEKNISISILLNGSKNSEIKEFFTKIPGVKFYSSEKNKGAVGGRNYLLTKQEIIKSDIILSLDNDVILPTDYIYNICEFLVSHPEAGIINPIVLKAQYFKEFFDCNLYNSLSNLNSDTLPKFSSEGIKRHLIEHGDIEWFYYIGTYNWTLSDCLATPTSIQNFSIWLKKKRIIKRPFYLLITRDPKTFTLIKSGIECFDVQTTGAGFQGFRTSLIDEIGKYEIGYNPFGLADRELSIRALKAGYTNYIICNTVAFHGTDNRKSKRSHAWGKRNYARSRVITIRKLCKSPMLKYFAFLEILIHTVITALLHNFAKGDFTFKSVRYGLRGWWEGLTLKLTDNKFLAEKLKQARESALENKEIANKKTFS